MFKRFLLPFKDDDPTAFVLQAAYQVMKERKPKEENVERKGSECYNSKVIIAYKGDFK